MCVVCMKYRIIILIIISLGKIILSYMANTSRTHACMRTHTHEHTCAHTHTRRHPGCRCSVGRCAPNHDEVNAPFSPVPLAMNDRSVLHSNKQSRMRRAVANGPVGPAMAGPIIEPANFFFFFFSFLNFLLYCFGRNNN